MSAEHGTAARYKDGHCRCSPCRYAASAARRRRRPYGDPAVVRDHIKMLSQAGIGYRRAAELAGTNWRTVYKIVWNGRRPMAATVEKILAVQPTDPPADRGVPPIGPARRLQALRAIGWSNVLLTDRLGITPTAGSALVMGRREWVMRSTAAAVAALYAELSEQPAVKSAGASRNRTYARQRGWFPPIAWEPETIDDPDGLPCLLPPVEPVDRDLELRVQHLVAGHPVEPTVDAIREIIHRAPDRKVGEIARMAQTTPGRVSNLKRSLVKGSSC